MNYKELQEWGRQRRRTIIVHQRVEPGEVLLFSDRKRYRVMPNGSRVRIFPDAPVAGLETTASLEGSVPLTLESSVPLTPALSPGEREKSEPTILPQLTLSPQPFSPQL